MINVCFLLGGFEGNGGIGRATSIVMNRLANEKNVSVFAVSYCQTGGERLYRISDGIHEEHLFDRQLSMTKAILMEHAIKKFKNITKKNHIDIVFACGALFFPLAIMATKGTDTKCVCVEHTSPETEFDHKFQALCRKFAIKRADKMVTITDAATDFYINRLKVNPNRIVRIYNPVPSEYYQSKSYNVESKKIVSIGRLTYQKNFERMIDIAKVILKANPEWEWDVFGEGELRRELQEKIDFCGISDKLRLKGQVPNLINRYGDYSFIVMTSRYEGFPMSLLEASANRLPMISFDVKTGPNEIIKDGKNGYLLANDDTGRMIERIFELIRSKERRYGMSAEAFKTAGQFGIESIIREWNALIEQLGTVHDSTI